MKRILRKPTSLRMINLSLNYKFKLFHFLLKRRFINWSADTADTLQSGRKIVDIKPWSRNRDFYDFYDPILWGGYHKVVVTHHINEFSKTDHKRWACACLNTCAGIIMMRAIRRLRRHSGVDRKIAHARFRDLGEWEITPWELVVSLEMIFGGSRKGHVLF